ncbi:MAG: type I methionyl aminopeptidase [Bacteroidia bacterium]
MKRENWAVYDEETIAKIRRAAQTLSLTLAHVASHIAPGVSTLELDRQAEAFIRDHGARPAFKGYHPPFASEAYPYTLCISINHQIVHGVPSEKVFLREGDIVSVDCGVEWEGHYADMAYTFPVGHVAPPIRLLLEVTYEALQRGIAAARVGNTLGDIGHAIEHYVKSYNFALTPQLSGHGIGKGMHLPPDVKNTGQKGKGPRLVEGLVIAIEPMVQIGKPKTRLAQDGWTIETWDGSWSAHYEHTVAIWADGPEVLTDYTPIEKVLYV